MLYILKYKEGNQYCGVNTAVVVRASSEAHARDVAASVNALEGPCVWLNPEGTTCEAIEPNGEPMVIMIEHMGWDA